MSHPWMSHVSHMNATYNQPFIIAIKAIKPQELAHTLWNYVHDFSHMDGSCLTHESVTSHTWMRHIFSLLWLQWRPSNHKNLHSHSETMCIIFREWMGHVRPWMSLGSHVNETHIQPLSVKIKTIKPTESTHSFWNHILEFCFPMVPHWHRRLPPLHFETLKIRWSKFVDDSSSNMENIENIAYCFNNVRRCHVVKWVLWFFKIRWSKFVDVSSSNMEKIVYCFNDVRHCHVVKWVLWLWSCSKVGVVVLIRLSSDSINCAEPRVTWLIRMLRHNSLTCETWLIHTWDMTHSYRMLRQNSFKCETWLCSDRTPSHVGHYVFMWKKEIKTGVFRSAIVDSCSFITPPPLPPPPPT